MKSLILGLVLFLCILSCQHEDSSDKGSSYTTWTSYLGGNDRNHFTRLAQINPQNVKNLKIAWEYETPEPGQMQMNAVIIDTLLFGVTSDLRAFALDARSGREVWIFGDSLKVWHSTSRGVSYWKKGKEQRIFYTLGSDLWALDALTGEPVRTFGTGGKIDLRSGLPENAQDKFVISNTPGTIYKDYIIMPLRVSEDLGAAAGDIMAFNCMNGRLEWVFHTIPHPDEPGFDTWENQNNPFREGVGAANNWAGMALDEEHEILFVPTGSAAPDFYGGIRKGQNLFANSLLAIDVNSGSLLWYYQFTHHDIWDRDPPAPPNLITLEREGKKIPAVAQITKQGYVYVFDRISGKPLFEITEKPVPPSELEGEQAWKTQPFPMKPDPFARQSADLTEENISLIAPDRDSLVRFFKNADKRIYAPPGLDPVLLLPGYDGGAEWGGAGADPERGILYVNSNEMAWVLQMKSTVNDQETESPGSKIYQTNCAVCHQEDRKGLEASGYPSLLELEQKYHPEEIGKIIAQGKGKMTGFPGLSRNEIKTLIYFLINRENELNPEDLPVTVTEQPQLPYQHLGYTKFLDANGNPAIDPPWGTLHAIDLNSGDFLWSQTLGITPGITAPDGTNTGTENYGGPLITENGLLFIAATKDGYFRAFDRYSGRLLWETQLPAAGFATPSTYQINGKQYIVVACGGEKLGTEKGNKIIAFAIE